MDGCFKRRVNLEVKVDKYEHKILVSGFRFILHYLQVAVRHSSDSVSWDSFSKLLSVSLSLSTLP